MTCNHITMLPLTRRLYILLFSALFVGSSAWAVEPRPLHQPEVFRSELPMPEVKQGNVPEPEVTITTSGDNTSVEEYRVNGQIYMVKITPAKGYPYYLIDTDGDGDLDSRRNDLEGRPVSQWILFRW